MVLILKRNKSRKSRNQEIAIYVENPIYYSFLAKLVEKHKQHLSQQLSRIEELFRVHVNSYRVRVFLIDEQYICAKITEVLKRGNKIRYIDHIIPSINDGGKLQIYIPDYLERELRGLRELVESYNNPPQ